MEDIEDLLVGSVGGGGDPPGFRLPFMEVGLKPKQQKTKTKTKRTLLTSNGKTLSTPEIPGTQVRFTLMNKTHAVFYLHFLYLISYYVNLFLYLQTIYMKTFGCSHNQASNDYRQFSFMGFL